MNPQKTAGPQDDEPVIFKNLKVMKVKGRLKIQLRDEGGQRDVTSKYSVTLAWSSSS